MDVAIIAVKNSLSELYVHQRVANKPTFPGLYGLGAGGKVDNGESPLNAGERELFEELGIELSIQPLFGFDFRHPQANYRVHVFGAIYDGAITPCKREFQWSGWKNRESIERLVAAKELCPDTEIVYCGLRDSEWI